MMETVRLDKWLWAARFYKTRSLAQAACAGGKVDVNGQAAKPSRALRAGDRIHLTMGEWRRELVVAALSERRGPATEARDALRGSLAATAPAGFPAGQGDSPGARTRPPDQARASAPRPPPRLLTARQGGAVAPLV